MILEELGLPYETSWVEIEDPKKEPYESIHPNGRVPGMPRHLQSSPLRASLSLKHFSLFISFRRALTFLPLTAIKDPNTCIMLWESAATISCLIDTYDKKKIKLTYASSSIIKEVLFRAVVILPSVWPESLV